MEDRLKKIFLPIVLLAASASFTLTGQSCSMPKGNTQPDTIVRAEFVDSSDEWKDTEYYVTTKKDTSALSCIITTRDGKVKNVEFYNLVGSKICFTGKISVKMTLRQWDMHLLFLMIFIVPHIKKQSMK